MMPSRGWHLARGSAPRLYQAQCRNLSSATRRIQPRSTQNGLASQRIPQWRLSTPITIASLPSIRHASTTPTSTPTLEPVTAPPPSSFPAESTSTTTSFPNLDTITLDDIDLSTTADLSALPEKIGYLHEIGLNYGWGPTSMIEWAVEHLHIYAGLPWWGAVAATAIGIRLIMIPLYIKSSDMTARSAALMSVTKPLTDKMTAARKSGDTAAVQQAWMEMRQTRKKAGLSMRDQMAPLFIQGVLGYCGFKLMRAMTALPVPALKTDGFLWLQDMTIADPFLILPILMAGTMHLLVRMGGESGAAGIDQMAPPMRFMMLWGLPSIIVATLGFQSGLVCVWFASGGALGILQSLALKNEKVRAYLKMAPLYKPSKDELDHGPMSEMMQSFMGSRGGASAGTKTSSPRKNSTAWMNPTYQSPNLRRNMNSTGSQPGASGRVIDVNPVQKPSTFPATPASKSASPNDDMIQPNKPPPTPRKGGVLDQASEKFNSWTKSFKGRPLSEEEMADKRKEDFQKRAKAYEKRYQKRQGGRGR